MFIFTELVEDAIMSVLVYQDEFRCHELEIAHQTDPAKVGGKLDGTWNPPAWDLSQARAASAQLTVPTTADKRVRQAPEKNLREADGGTDSPESTWLYCLAHFATVGNVTKHEEDVALPKRGARQADIPAQQEQPHKRARLHVQRYVRCLLQKNGISNSREM